MKDATKLFLVIVLLFGNSSSAQTNVSGGIYTDATWNISNSPYIVVDTVVVFPNVTLTIEPGVEVRFEQNMRIEFRQARLIAEGTINDSITFTSNASVSPAGYWGEILLNGGNLQGLLHAKFNYCNIKYARYGINYDAQSPNGNYDTIIINNSNFRYNDFGIFQTQPTSLISIVDSTNFDYNTNDGIHYFANAIFNYCNISNNNRGIWLHAFGNNVIKNCSIFNNANEGISMPAQMIISADSIIDCLIRYNGTGISTYSFINPTVIVGNTIENNSTGMHLNNSSDIINCNKLCDNTSYNIFYAVTGGNLNMANNYWCTSDVSVISAGIYDGYDNINLGLVIYQPIDTVQCYLSTSIASIEDQSVNFNVFPSPVIDFLSVFVPENMPIAELRIINMLGTMQYVSITGNSEIKIIDVSALSAGIYFIEISAGNNFSRKKFIKQ